jgi:hypothetical protein
VARRFFLSVAVRQDGPDVNVYTTPFIGASEEEAIGAMVRWSGEQTPMPLVSASAQEYTLEEVQQWAKLMVE